VPSSKGFYLVKISAILALLWLEQVKENQKNSQFFIYIVYGDSIFHIYCVFL
jgi:hypothetical protein